MKQPSIILKRVCLCLSFIAYTALCQAQTTIIPTGSSWKYWANSLANFQANWETVAYNDAAWPSGTGELGYGDGDEGTCIPSGGGGTLCAPSGNKWGSYYFRKVVNIANPAVYSNFTFNVERDDGFVLYVNGVEQQRNNIAAGPVSYITPAVSAIEDATISFTIPTSAFVSGNNTIAVEVHQSPNNASGITTSSDISFNLSLLGNDAFSAGMSRAPYLQVGTQTSIKIRWQTSAAENSRVEIGTVFGTYPTVVTDPANVTEHIITISGLTPDTKYYYRVGNSTNMQTPNSIQYFNTLPPPNTTRKVRIAAFGDCGRNSAAYQDATLASYQNYLTTNGLDAPDAWLLMGDNAYTTGSQTEYNNNFFGIYGNNLLRNHKLYPAPGNHDYGNSAANKASRVMPYHTNFTVPQAGEAGGVASNKQNYYSYDIGNIHFLSLDSYGTESDGTSMETAAGSALKTWLTADLAANTRKWVIAYWHHPPYTKTSHNSDSEGDLVNIRQNFIDFLENRGVDMIICGHSHGYERGYLIKNYNGNWASFSTATHAVSTSNARYDNSSNCPYVYNTTPADHGTVYVVAGSAGASGGTNAGFATGPMPFAVNDAGVFYFEVEDNRLDAKMIRDDGSIFDQFTIMKDVNTSNTFNITNGTSQDLAASWPQAGNYTWVNTTGTTRSVTVTPPNNATTVYQVRDAFNCVQDQFTINTSGTLPVTLKDYEVKLVNGKVLVTWSTETENNSKHFTVERSQNGTDFSFVGKVDAAGFSTSTKNYSFTDPNPFGGASYYRLSQSDNDGKTAYMGIRRVNNNNPRDFDVKVLSGNPGRLVLQVNTQTEAVYQVSIVDMSGKRIKSETISFTAGQTRKEYQLIPGVYIWEVRNNKGAAIMQKVVVQ
jgi:acid phosphatase type 7